MIIIILFIIIIMQQDNILEKPDSHTLDRQGRRKGLLLYDNI